MATYSNEGKKSDNAQKRIETKIDKMQKCQLLKNWKPISLLNVDHSIGAKALANGLQNILHYVINPNQTCNITGRSILDNYYLIPELLLF